MKKYTEYDRSILRGIIALLHTPSDPTLSRRKIKEVIEVAEECRMSIVAGKDIVNLRLKDRLKRIDAEIEEKKTVLEKKTRNAADTEFNFLNMSAKRLHKC